MLNHARRTALQRRWRILLGRRHAQDLQLLNTWAARFLPCFVADWFTAWPRSIFNRGCSAAPAAKFRRALSIDCARAAVTETIAPQLVSAAGTETEQSKGLFRAFLKKPPVWTAIRFPFWRSFYLPPSAATADKVAESVVGLFQGHRHRASQPWKGMATPHCCRCLPHRWRPSAAISARPAPRPAKVRLDNSHSIRGDWILELQVDPSLHQLVPFTFGYCVVTRP